MTTFTEITQASAALVTAATISFSPVSHAHLHGGGSVFATSSVLSGGVLYRDGVASISGGGGLTASDTLHRVGAASISGGGSIRQGEGATSQLLPLAVLSADGAYSQGAVELVPITSSSTSPEESPAYGTVETQLYALTSVSSMLTGQIGDAVVELQPLAVIAADGPYAQATVAFDYMFGLSNDGPGPLEAESMDILLAYDSMAVEQELGVDMLETVEVSDELTFTRIVPEAIDASMQIEAEFTVNGEFLAEIMATVNVVDGVLQAFPQAAWVVNTSAEVTVTNSRRKVYANSRYEQYDFNSFGRMQDRFFGAKADGIYELIGDTDDGDPIVATVVLNKDDYGIAQMKRTRHVYVDMQSNGILHLTVVTDTGARYTYAVEAAAYFKNVRVDIGKGIRSKRWQHEYTNPDGADFTVNKAEVVVDTTARRV